MQNKSILPWFLKDVIQEQNNIWPFKEDLSDVKIAYTEIYDRHTGNVRIVLLKNDKLILFTFRKDENKKPEHSIEITEIFLNKIICCKRRYKGNNYKFESLTTEIILQNSDQYILKAPNLDIGENDFMIDNTYRNFIKNNSLNYNFVINEIMS